VLQIWGAQESAIVSTWYIEANRQTNGRLHSDRKEMGDSRTIVVHRLGRNPTYIWDKSLVVPFAFGVKSLQTMQYYVNPRENGKLLTYSVGCTGGIGHKFAIHG
jgi:hypothetical protein